MAGGEPFPDTPSVRTYHARTGRLSGAKRRALDALLPHHALLPHERPGALDFGCGTGEALVAGAAARPDLVWLGVDVQRAALATAARRIAEAGLPNVRLHLGDGVELLSRRIDVESLQVAQILFPDPWPKQAHRRRRLIQAPFVALLAGRLATGAVVVLATDDPGYGTQMLGVLGACSRLHGGAAERPEGPPTFYELRARTAGRPILHLRYVAT